jgi:hypothetical protein
MAKELRKIIVSPEINTPESFGGEVVATRFRIRTAAEGNGVESMPIGGVLHPPLGSEEGMGELLMKGLDCE